MKICPIMTGRGKYWNNQYCLECECAWWSEAAQECCIKNFFATDSPKSNSSMPIKISETLASDPEYMTNVLENYNFEVGM